MPALIRERAWVFLLALAVLALLCAGAGIRLGARPVRAQTSGDQSLLLQLAERLLSAQPFGLGGTAQGVQLYPGALAPDFPSSVPLPPSIALIGSDERPSYSSPPPIYNGIPVPQATPAAPSGVHVDVVLDVPGSADDLMSFYKQALSGAGWTPPTNATYSGSGFIASGTTPQPTTYCRPSDHAQFVLAARPTNAGPLDVRLSYDSGFNPQCSAQATVTGVGMPVVPVGQGLLPALQPPQGARITTEPGIAGPFRSGSDATATTDMSMLDLHSFYAGELSAAGWTQTNSGGDASLAWSTWSIPDHPDLQGFLYVRDGPASGRRSLHLEIGSTSPNTSPFPAPPGGSVTTIPNPAPATPTPTATPVP